MGKGCMAELGALGSGLTLVRGRSSEPSCQARGKGGSITGDLAGASLDLLPRFLQLLLPHGVSYKRKNFVLWMGS